MKRYLDDILIILGAGLITLGAWFVLPVSALFVAGAFLIAFGLMIGYGSAVSRGPEDRHNK